MLCVARFVRAPLEQALDVWGLWLAGLLLTALPVLARVGTLLGLGSRRSGTAGACESEPCA